MTYDPQRGHARQPVAASDPAPVDALIGETDEPDPGPAAPGPGPDPGPARDARPADRAPSSVPSASSTPADGGIGRLVAVAATALVLLALLWWWRQRRRRG